MWSRITLGLLLIIEIAALLLVAVGLVMGERLAQPEPMLWLIIAAAFIATFTVLGLPAAAARAAAIHATLLCGLIIFGMPLFWLLTTSFKYPEETFAYPPRWLPQVPREVSHSPYAVLPEKYHNPDGPPVRPLDPSDESLWRTIEPSIPRDQWDALVMPLPRDSSPNGARGASDAAALGPAPAAANLKQALLERLAESGDGRPPQPEAVRAAWDQMFHALELGPVTVYGNGGRVHRLQLDDTTLHARGAAAVRADQAVRIHYHFSPAGSDHFELRAALPLPFDAADLRRLDIAMRQDRSWHRWEVELLVHGQRYRSTHALHLGHRRWVELGWSLNEQARPDLGVFPMQPLGPEGNATDSHAAQLILRVHRTPRWQATLAKYTEAYRQAWYADPYWPRYLLNTAVLVALNVVGQVISCSLVAFAFARLRWPGRDSLFLMLLASMMLPPQVTLVPTFLIFTELGWYNTLLPLWVPAFLTAPFYVFLLRQVMRSIPRDLEEAAMIDGCSRWGLYLRIVLPLTRPGLAAVAVFTFIGTWNEFLGPLIYLSDARRYPLAMGLYNFRNEHGGDFNMLTAATVIMTLPVLVLFLFTQRYFVQGATLTGIKG